jgi:histidyl-tRNA synthetase
VAKGVRTVKGTRDLLPPETAVWQAVEETARSVFGAYGYEEIRTPILEETDLFVRSVGESTDIVGKEMYTFSDKKGRALCLRPENTASVARAYIQHALRERPKPLKLYYIGPQFRYERPQKGRYRQFHQIGAELIGDAGPLSDAELLLMLVRFLNRLGFDDLTVLLNTLGDSASRAAYREALREYFTPHREGLGADSRRRLDSNPLRILDTKVPSERELVEGAPLLSDSLNEASRAHFAEVEGHLEAFGVDYRVDPALVRGLDYYTSTVFEIVAAGLGAQAAIVGGGRYDRLVSDLGGGEVPAIGFAIGQDRLIEVLPESFRADSLVRRSVMVVPAGGDTAGWALETAERLRDRGLDVVLELSGRSVRAALKQAHRSGVGAVVLLGEDELASGRPTVRDMEAGEQFDVAPEELAQRLVEIANGSGESG